MKYSIPITLAGIIILVGVNLRGKPSFSVNNLLKYGEGEHYIYRENLLDVNMFYGDWSAYTQIELSNPPEFGRDFTGINQISLEYRSRLLEIRLGDVYPLWNRGLMLNLRYERDLGYDSGIRGGEIRFFPSEWLTIMSIAGHQRFRFSSPRHNDFRTHNWEEISTAAGAGISVTQLPLNSNFSLAVLGTQSDRPYDYLNRETLAVETDTYPVDSRFAEGYLRVTPGRWEFIVNRVESWMNLQEPWEVSVSYLPGDTLNSGRGNATYLGVNGVLGGLGISLEYKNYAYDIRPPGIWQDTFGERPTRMTPFQRPPIVYREHEATLVSRQQHQVSFNDELGWQIELNYSGIPGTYLSGNFAMASRHFSYAIRNNRYHQIRTAGIFPGTTKGFYPFNQVHLQGEQYLFDNALYLKQSLDRQYEVEEYSLRESLTDEGVRESYHKNSISKEVYTSLTSVDYTFSGGSSVSLTHENQWLERDFLVRSRQNDAINESTKAQSFYYRYITLSYRHRAGVTLSLIYDYASRTEQGEEYNVDPANDNVMESVLRSAGVDLRNKWFGLEATIDLLPHHQLTLFYGSEKGGLRCSNGVCREVPPFEDGFKITLQTVY